MITLTKYRCQICGLESEEKDEVLECEFGHQGAENILAVQTLAYPTGDPLPDKLEVLFADGTKAIYEFVDTYEQTTGVMEDLAALHTPVGTFEDGSPMVVGDEAAVKAVQAAYGMRQRDPGQIGFDRSA